MQKFIKEEIKKFVKLNFSRHNRLNNFVYGRIILKDNILQNSELKEKNIFFKIRIMDG